MEINIPAWATYLTVSLVGILGAFAVQRFIAFRTACATFRTAFNGELATLESMGGMTVATRDLLLSAHLKHSAAIAEFGRHLFWCRPSFNKCWQQHHYGHSFDANAFEIPKQDRLYLIYLAINDVEEDAAINLAVKNIHALLRFAKET